MHLDHVERPGPFAKLVDAGPDSFWHLQTVCLFIGHVVQLYGLPPYPHPPPLVSPSVLQISNDDDSKRRVAAPPVCLVWRW